MGRDLVELVAFSATRSTLSSWPKSTMTMITTTIDNLMPSHWARNQLLSRQVRICHLAQVPCSRSDITRPRLALAREALCQDSAPSGPLRRLLELIKWISEPRISKPPVENTLIFAWKVWRIARDKLLIISDHVCILRFPPR